MKNANFGPWPIVPLLSSIICAVFWAQPQSQAASPIISLIPLLAGCGQPDKSDTGAAMDYTCQKSDEIHLAGIKVEDQGQYQLYCNDGNYDCSEVSMEMKIQYSQERSRDPSMPAGQAFYVNVGSIYFTGSQLPYFRLDFLSANSSGETSYKIGYSWPLGALGVDSETIDEATWGFDFLQTIQEDYLSKDLLILQDIRDDPYGFRIQFQLSIPVKTQGTGKLLGHITYSHTYDPATEWVFRDQPAGQYCPGEPGPVPCTERTQVCPLDYSKSVVDLANFTPTPWVGLASPGL